MWPLTVGPERLESEVHVEPEMGHTVSNLGPKMVMLGSQNKAVGL